MKVMTVERQDGITNGPVDPTVWVTWTLRAGRIAQLKLSAVWDVTVEIVVLGRRWFGSDRVNPGLLKATEWLFGFLEQRYERRNQYLADDQLPVRWAM